MIAQERTKEIPEKKVQLVKELSDLAKTKKTVMVCSIKNIPASQFQQIMKKLRGKAIIKVPKKNLIFKALDSSDDESIKKLKDEFGDSTALLFSDLDCFDLAMELAENKTPARAKAGQEAPEDIYVDKGPTDLPPGPAISELGALGLQVQIDKGKISIREGKVIVEKGKKISAEAANVMSKLDMKPFLLQFIPIVAFDTENKKLYFDIKIDKEEAIEGLKNAFGRALPFAVSIEYISDNTIRFLLQKAGTYSNKINRIVTGEPEPVAEVQTEDTQEEKEEKEEPKADAAEGLASLFG